ncbi:hypothetical protein SAMN05444166_4831 [Singulisphaera sp. GP187]|nr:hypothetical protein SAMN05444166_4831 [Singulisphaera sp. GP187]
MPTSLEACRLAMLVIGIAAIPVALLIEWMLPSSRSRRQAQVSLPTPTPIRPPTGKSRILRATTLREFWGRHLR